MEVNYKRVWKLLIDRDIKKLNSQNVTKISAVIIAKLGRNKNVITTTLAKIFTVLNCNDGDVMDIVDKGINNDTKTEASLHEK